MRIMLDTNVFDRIAGTNGLTGHLNHLVKSGAISLLTTPIQESELAAVPNPARRKRLQSVERLVVPAATDIDWQQITAKHRHDALIATTAATHAELLVTEDTYLVDRLRQANETQVLTYSEFLSLLPDWPQAAPRTGARVGGRGRRRAL